MEKVEALKRSKSNAKHSVRYASTSVVVPRLEFLLTIILCFFGGFGEK